MQEVACLEAGLHPWETEGVPLPDITSPYLLGKLPAQLSSAPLNLSLPALEVTASAAHAPPSSASSWPHPFLSLFPPSAPPSWKNPSLASNAEIELSTRI